MVSAVSLAEAATRLGERGVSETETASVIAALGLTVLPFDEELACRTAQLRRPVRGSGLSLGDRACLALAGRGRVPALTADRAWADLDIGVEIELVRE